MDRARILFIPIHPPFIHIHPHSSLTRYNCTYLNGQTEDIIDPHSSPFPIHLLCPVIANLLRQVFQNLAWSFWIWLWPMALFFVLPDRPIAVKSPVKNLPFKESTDCCLMQAGSDKSKMVKPTLVEPGALFFGGGLSFLPWYQSQNLGQSCYGNITQSHKIYPRPPCNGGVVVAQCPKSLLTQIRPSLYGSTSTQFHIRSISQYPKFGSRYPNIPI